MKNKKEKGQYGYRDSHRKMQLLLVLFFAAMVVVQLAARAWVTTSEAENILTVMAVLSVLPAANVASPLLASWKYKTGSMEFYQRVSSYEQTCSVLYDLILTSRDFIMPADAIIVHPLGVYLYCTSSKVTIGQAENYLNQMLSDNKLNLNAKVFHDETLFFHHLDSLGFTVDFEDEASVKYTMGLLKNLSM